MAGAYTKRKLKKIKKQVVAFLNDKKFRIRRYFVRRAVKERDFTIISNNCWGGRTYQYFDMPYLSPTVGLYFYSEDYLKFVSDLHYYLNIPLKFISASQSKYYEELKKRGQTEKVIGVLDDVEIVFLHYKSEEEALEKWNRRKARINFNNVILKYSWSNLCEENHLEMFDNLPFDNKIMLVDKTRKNKYNCGVYWSGKINEKGIVGDTEPFPGNLNLKNLLKNQGCAYPSEGLKR